MERSRQDRELKRWSTGRKTVDRDHREGGTWNEGKEMMVMVEEWKREMRRWRKR
jgi:hypothetical protein